MQVCDGFHDVNAALIAEGIKTSGICRGLSARDRDRALRIFDVVFRHPEMRNRNILHAGVLDSCVIGNLLNFPKHVFQFPFGSHATDGNEALSLCLYSYRQLWEQRAAVTDGANAVSNEESSVPVILCVNNVRSNVQFESSALSNISQCAARLGMTVDCCESAAQVDSVCSRRRVAVVIARLHDPDLAEIAEAAHRVDQPAHSCACTSGANFSPDIHLPCT